MRIEKRPWSRDSTGVDLFTDRVPESRILADALAFHSARVRSSLIDSAVFHNVVTFYGVSGTGKTRLSERADRWLTGRLADTDPWGPPPAEGILSARWDFNDSLGNVDVVAALLAVRNELGRTKRVWPAFDLAFASYYATLRPGEPIPTSGAKDSGFADGIVDILSDIASDLGIAVGTVVNLSAATVRLVVRVAKKKWRQRSAFAAVENFEEILVRCTTEPASGNPSPDLAAELLWLLTAEIDAMDAAHRPVLAIFIDHFERLQVRGRRDGERIVNRLVASLPYSLFVVTGKNVLDWARDDRAELDVAGNRAWPGLLPGATEGPRQHELGWLSDDDVRDLVGRYAEEKRLVVAADTVDEIAKATGGWPVHIVAIMTYAERLREKDPGHSLTVEDVGTSFDGLINRLLDDLPDDEAQALQSACVLPYFDLGLVGAVAVGVDDGAVMRLCARPIVSSNPGSDYHYRIHDQVRRIIRSAGAHVRQGWSESDWKSAVGRAIEEAWGRYRAAVKAGDDSAAMQAIALVITLCIENDTHDDGLVSAVRQAPSIAGLRSMLPPSDVAAGNPEIMNLLKHIEALALPFSDSMLRMLDEVFHSGTRIASSSGLWRAYRLRKSLRFDEALEQLRSMLEMDTARQDLARRQILITLAQARRFELARQGLGELGASQAASVMESIERDCGTISRAAEILVPRIEAASSRRFQLELLGDLLMARTRLGEARPDDARALLASAVAVGHSSAERFAETALAMLSLFDDEEFHRHLRRVDEIESTLAAVASPVSLELVALRALATGDTGDLDSRCAEAARLRVRSSAWIGVEVTLDLLGRGLPRVETQWLEPYEIVSGRWQEIVRTVIARARAESVSGKPE